MDTKRAAAAMGKKGGRSKSPRKVAAARANIEKARGARQAQLEREAARREGGR